MREPPEAAATGSRRDLGSTFEALRRGEPNLSVLTKVDVTEIIEDNDN